MPRASMFNFQRLYILCAWIGHLSEKLGPYEFLESFRCSLLSVPIYHGPRTYTRVKSHGHLNMPRASVFNFEGLYILCAWIGLPSEKLWPFEFLERFPCSLSRISLYHGPRTHTRVKSHGGMNMSRASIFNFERLNILCAWIGHPSEKLWPFEFLESFHCSLSSVPIYHGPRTYTRVKSHGRLNMPRASIFNFECLYILCAWIGHPSEKLWPFEFLERFRCSLSSVPIYHGPRTYTRVKSYSCLNLPRAFGLNFERLDILCTWIRHSSEILGPFEFLEGFHCSLSSIPIYHEPHTFIGVKSYGRLNMPSASMFNFERLYILCP